VPAATPASLASLPPWLERLRDCALAREPPSRADALSLLRCPDELLLDVVAAAGRVRREFFSNRVKLNYLVNLKSGLCGEDCYYCSQRRGSEAGVLRYSWLSAEVAATEARRAAARGAKRVCLVASGRGPSEKDIERVAAVVEAIRTDLPGLEVCVCLGLLAEGQAERLAAAGAYAYNHNLNTAPSYYGSICTTHTFSERASTVRRARAAGLSPCSGVIVGMGESDEQLVEVALELLKLRPDSVPVNFLMPFPGTPMEGRAELTPARCLKVLAMFRFYFPGTEVRVAGGREMHLRSLQPLGLHIANSIFVGDYLTSEGQAAAADLQMIADAGFVVEQPDGAWEPGGASPSGDNPNRAGPGEDSPNSEPSPSAGDSPSGAPSPSAGDSPRLQPAVRRRGPGTALPSNA
jgi:biotin synthase